MPKCKPQVTCNCHIHCANGQADSVSETPPPLASVAGEVLLSLLSQINQHTVNLSVYIRTS